MLPQQESPLVQRSNHMEDAVTSRGHRRSGSLVIILCGGCLESQDSSVENSLPRPLWFQKIRQSTSGPDAADSDSQNWLRRGWNSVRRAGDWPESVVEEFSGGCCRGAKWSNFARRFKANGKTICNSGPTRFNYDALSYELNFDDGLRPEWESQGLPLRMGSPAGKIREFGAS